MSEGDFSVARDLADLADRSVARSTAEVPDVSRRDGEQQLVVIAAVKRRLERVDFFPRRNVVTDAGIVTLGIFSS